jgi:hypothetical protein
MIQATDISHNSNADLVQGFQALDVDGQLALFWFIYQEMGASVTPAAPGASTTSSEVAQGLYNQVKEKSHEEQLQIQRDLVSRTGGDISRHYGALSDTTKLLFWYFLAQGMDSSEIIPFPDDYQLSSEAQSLLERIKQIEFNEQIAVFRDIVAPMGVDPT